MQDTIVDLQTLKRFFRAHLKTPVFGAGVYAFHRLGPEEFLPDYRILALRDSLDTRLIEKDVKVIVLEKGMGAAHLDAPRNATTVLSHPKVRAYLSGFKRPVVLVYKTSEKMEGVAKKEGWILAQNRVTFGKTRFEHKARLRKILSRIGVPVPPGEIVTLSHTTKDLDEPRVSVLFTHLYRRFRKTYGVPFVVQHPTRGGGKGTFFIRNEEEFFSALRNLRVRIPKDDDRRETEKKTHDVVVAQFVRGPSPSITGCVTRHGILSTNLQNQILDSPFLYNPRRGAGLFCGHDWSGASFPPHIEKEAYRIVEKIGTLLKQEGYRGVFGIDFVLDESRKRLYVTECNPRLLGSFPTLAMVQLASHEPPILAFHILEYLGIPYRLDREKINRLMRKKKEGAQMLLHNLSGVWAKNHDQLEAGVYRLREEPATGPPGARFAKGDDRQPILEFLRPGYKLRHIENKGEFLITEGVPFKKSHFSPNRRLLRILTSRSALGRPPRDLAPWAQHIAQIVYAGLKIRPVRFARIIKWFNPRYLAKG